MTHEQFGDNYAASYDAIYGDKDYEGECDYLESLFVKYRNAPVKTILDVACGTGNHAIPLAKRGFVVTAQDISNSMVQMGIRKAIERGVQIDWHSGMSMQNFTHDKKFDAVICMFSAIDYLIRDEDIRSTLINIQNHLSEDGLFIMDFWNRSAVENSYSPRRDKTVQDHNRLVKRTSNTSLDISRRHAHISIGWEIQEDGKTKFSDEERHTCRYFDIGEMVDFLNSSKLDVLDIHPFMNINSDITRDTWNITVVSRRQSA